MICAKSCARRKSARFLHRREPAIRRRCRATASWLWRLVRTLSALRVRQSQPGTALSTTLSGACPRSTTWASTSSICRRSIRSAPPIARARTTVLQVAADDVGSPYAIGSTEGGHDAIHPALGTIEDFRRLRDAAAAQGMELALDFAIQCSPDHPWLKDHPEWFNWRPDGTVRYAENPPKKYQDIVNVDFYGRNPIPSSVAGSARHRAVLGRRRRAHLSCRQSAHQATAVLGMADCASARHVIPT